MNSMQDIIKLKGTFKTPTPELSSASRGMYISPCNSNVYYAKSKHEDYARHTYLYASTYL